MGTYLKLLFGRLFRLGVYEKKNRENNRKCLDSKFLTNIAKFLPKIPTKVDHKSPFFSVGSN